jgi:hypothetical protein
MAMVILACITPLYEKDFFNRQRINSLNWFTLHGHCHFSYTRNNNQNYYGQIDLDIKVLNMFKGVIQVDFDVLEHEKWMHQVRAFL